jgi:hypothetical protein
MTAEVLGMRKRISKRSSAKFSDKDGDRRPSSPFLPQPEEGQHGNNDDNQTDDVDDLVHGDLRFVCAVTITSIAQSSRCSANGKAINRRFIAVFSLISRNQIDLR